MQMLNDGWRGISLLVNINADRILFLLVTAGSLSAAAYIAHP